jgi:hypothetical protein
MGNPSNFPNLNPIQYLILNLSRTQVGVLEYEYETHHKQIIENLKPNPSCPEKEKTNRSAN